MTTPADDAARIPGPSPESLGTLDLATENGLRALPDVLSGARAQAQAALAGAGPLHLTPPVLIHGDNLHALAALHRGGEPVDLIYIDPPYASGATYRMSSHHSGRDTVGFTDRWHAGLVEYLGMLAPRLLLMRGLLGPAGSIYVHVDWHASHWVRLLLDAIFGADAFLNEIAWVYGLGGSSPRRWPRKHDTILWYAATPGQQWFEPALIPATSARMRGQLKKAPDYWDIPAINNQARERTGYPTQKPRQLLDRIVTSSCPPGGLVLDAFCGSGTAAESATAHSRRWIAIDESDDAVRIAAARLGVDPLRLG